MTHDYGRSARRISNTVRLGKLTLAPVELNGVQRHQMQLNPFEVLDSVNSIQHFGLASSPPVGSDAVVLALGGDNTNTCVIGTNNNQLRPTTLTSGETVVYDAVGQQIYLSQHAGKISIVLTAGQEVTITAATDVLVTAPTVTVQGNLQVNGTINATGDISSGSVTLDTHTHGGGPVGSG